MSFAEVMLRIGSVLVAWMVVYAHVLWTAVVRVTDCQPDGDALWRLLLGFAPVTIGFTFLLAAMRPMPAIHRTLSWLALPLILLWPMALWPVVNAGLTTTLGGEPICGVEAWWHVLWAPVQLIALTVIAVMVWRLWRPRT